MSHNTNYKNEWPQSSPIVRLRYAVVAAAAIGGAAIYNQENILDNIKDLIQPRSPVAQVYNNDSCLAYDDKKYALFKGTALKGDGIGTLLLYHNPRSTPTLEDAFRAANGMGTSMLREGRQYLTPAPDKKNNCK